jgi:hypothetical protein
MSFFENITGFLFHPYGYTSSFLAENSNSYRKTIIFELYGAALLSIIEIFFIMYPEGVWYGLSFETAFKNLPFFNIYSPLILFLFFLVFWGTIIGMHFFGIGTLNYFIGKLLGGRDTAKRGRKEYLTVYGFSSMLPILLLGIVAIFWIYFFEKFYFATDISPYIDFTGPVLIFLCVLFVFMSWKWIMEVRINQRFFNTSIVRAAIPEVVQVFLLFAYFMFFEFLLSIFTSVVSWV